MITQAPQLITSAIKVLNKVPIQGVIENKADAAILEIRTSAGMFTFKADSEGLSPGDRVTITSNGSEFTIHKSGQQITSARLETIDSLLLSKNIESKFIELLNEYKNSLISHPQSALTTIKNALQLLDAYTLQDYSKEIDALKNKLLSLMQAAEPAGSINPKDLSELKALLNDIIKRYTAAQITSPVITSVMLKNNTSEGLYSFNSLTNALNFLNTPYIQNELTKTLNQNLEGSDQIFIKIQREKDRPRALIIDQKQVQTELRNAIINAKSIPMQNLSMETLEHVLSQKGYLDLNYITSMDNQLSKEVLNPAQKLLLTSNTFKESFNQWASNLLSSDKTAAEKMVQYPPLTSITKCLSDMHQLTAISSNESALRFTTGITDSILLSADKKAALSQAIASMGYDFESTLLDESRADQKESLKKQLYTILSDFQNAVSKGNVPFINKENILSKQVIYSGQKGFDLYAQLKIDTFTFIENCKKQLESGISISFQSPSERTDILNSLKKLIEQLQLLPSTADHENLRKLLQDITKLVEHAFSGDQTPDTTPLQVKNAVHKNELTTDAMMEFIKNTQSLTSMFKDQAESLLNKFESIQFLAKQTPHPEGQQQILSLPMKIGSEWTELQMRIIKKHDHSKKKQNNQQKFSVLLNVAPRFLGSIDVKIDYLLKKNLTITIQFELHATKNYFDTMKEQIKNALRDAGLPIHNLSFKSGQTTATAGAETESSKLIDLKV
jgi:hypothetical protein